MIRFQPSKPSRNHVVKRLVTIKAKRYLSVVVAGRVVYNSSLAAEEALEALALAELAEAPAAS
jgi:hypothetical protein